MAKIIPITEHFQHFLADLKESFWGDVYGQTKLACSASIATATTRRASRGWRNSQRVMATIPSGLR